MADSQKIPNYAKFLFGSIAGVGSTLVCFPLDVLKTRQQVLGAGAKSKSVTTLQLATNIIREEGILQLYNGLSASVLRQATYTGVRIGAYQTFVDYFTENGTPPSLLVKTACGVVSGALGGIAGLPADVSLTRMAADGIAPLDQRRNYTNVFNAIFRIYREEGFLALYRGLNATVIRAILVNISQLVSYTQAKETILKYGLMGDNTVCHVTCSIFSAFTATTCVLPADIAKTRIQNMKIINGVPEYRGVVDVWVKIITHEGVFSLWKGFTPLFLRNGPSFIVIFVIYENLSFMYKRYVLTSVSTKR